LFTCIRLQQNARDAARRAGQSATADTCVTLQLDASDWDNDDVLVDDDVDSASGGPSWSNKPSSPVYSNRLFSIDEDEEDSVSQSRSGGSSSAAVDNGVVKARGVQWSVAGLHLEDDLDDQPTPPAVTSVTRHSKPTVFEKKFRGTACVSHFCQIFSGATKAKAAPYRSCVTFFG